MLYSIQDNYLSSCDAVQYRTFIDQTTNETGQGPTHKAMLDKFPSLLEDEPKLLLNSFANCKFEGYNPPPFGGCWSIKEEYADETAWTRFLDPEEVCHLMKRQKIEEANTATLRSGSSASGSGGDITNSVDPTSGGDGATDLGGSMQLPTNKQIKQVNVWRDIKPLPTVKDIVEMIGKDGCSEAALLAELDAHIVEGSDANFRSLLKSIAVYDKESRLWTLFSLAGDVTLDVLESMAMGVYRTSVAVQSRPYDESFQDVMDVLEFHGIEEEDADSIAKHTVVKHWMPLVSVKPNKDWPTTQYGKIFPSNEACFSFLFSYLACLYYL